MIKIRSDGKWNIFSRSSASRPFRHFRFSRLFRVFFSQFESDGNPIAPSEMLLLDGNPRGGSAAAAEKAPSWTSQAGYLPPSPYIEPGVTHAGRWGAPGAGERLPAGSQLSSPPPPPSSGGGGSSRRPRWEPSVVIHLWIHPTNPLGQENYHVVHPPLIKITPREQNKMRCLRLWRCR